ncbi:centrosomal protein CEP57L1 isoform X3 [Alosa pseudoharengus]|uniref:centrosomal protein CEP57L1 isoform X3 n=1 Tax=Alosa pseudoharengus TaxID=34774 RepID=UPI003F8C5FDC
MDHFRDQNIFDTPSKQSYVGSFYLPPDKLSFHGFVKGSEEPKARSSTILQDIDAEAYRCTPDAGSRAVIAALRTLQEKMRRLELERAQAEKNVQRFSEATQQHAASSRNASANRNASINASRSASATTAASSVRVQDQPRTRQDANSKQRIELVTQLQSTESRCSLLEKQLDYMKKMLESAGEVAAAHAHSPSERYTHTPTEKKAQKENSIDDVQLQLDKLEKLERECVKLTNTQSLAERKIQLLEKKLQDEEKERKLMQQKADELQRELQVNLLMQSAAVAESKPKKKKEKLPVKKSELAPKFPLAKRPPFVAGTSTSPSHSVSANLQSLCHLLQQQQQQGHPESSHRRLRECERERQQLERQDCTRIKRRSKEAGRGQGDHVAHSPPSREASPLGCLSRLLLALQDELGHMSFEHQELVCQISETKSRRVREDLERELDALVRKMEEKATQITQLRKHQKTVESLRQPSRSPKKQQRPKGSKVKKVGVTGVQPLSPSPKKTRPHSVSHSLYASLRKDDIMWES